MYNPRVSSTWGAVAAALLLGLAGCNEGAGTSSGGDDSPPSNPNAPNPVRNLRIEADPDDGSKFIFRWSQPVLDQSGANAPDSYTVLYYYLSYDMLAEGEFVYIVDTSTTATEVSADPQSSLATLVIRGQNEFGAGPANTIELALLGWTDPYFFAFVDLHDEPALGFSGVEWNPEESSLGYRGGTMQSAAQVVDFYVTNFAEDSGTAPHFFASPHLAAEFPSDAAVVSDVEGLHQTEFLDLGTDPVDILPNPQETPYDDRAELITGHYYAVHMDDDYYGLMYVEHYNPGLPNFLDADVRIWASPVRGSRVFGLVTTPPDEPEFPG